MQVELRKKYLDLLDTLRSYGKDAKLSGTRSEGRGTAAARTENTAF